MGTDNEQNALLKCYDHMRSNDQMHGSRMVLMHVALTLNGPGWVQDGSGALINM
jgi:hypothetical protein